MGDDVLSSLLGMPEVLALDEDALAEHLLFLHVIVVHVHYFYYYMYAIRPLNNYVIEYSCARYFSMTSVVYN